MKSLTFLPVEIDTSEFDITLALGLRCAVCLEYDMEFPSTPPTPGCTHAIDVCASCLSSYVSSGINDALSLKCPTADCIGQMDVDEIQACIGEGHKQEFDRFCERKVRYFLQSEQALVWCRAPGCGSGQIHVGGAAWPIVTCQKCSARTCFTHDTVWHEGRTCAQFTKELKERAKAAPARALEVKKSEAWVKSHTKNCPGEGCGRPIQKHYGCDHMTCRKPAGCGHEFCWICLGPYKDVRGQATNQHKRDCKYYS